jgi:uncharacterized membrane protein YdjX (TVP38/TMEM64 family)
VDVNAERRPARAWRPALIAVVIAAALALTLFFDVRGAIASALDWIEGQGAIGAAVFVVLYVVATVLAFPASLLTLGAGAVYGLWLGFALVSLGSTLGATAAFLVARYAAREWVAARIAGNPRFRALDEGVATQGWKLVFLTRLSPVIPFNLQNYGYGLTRVPALHYALASWIGMMPGTLMYVYLGYTGASLARGGRTPAQWALLVFGLAATVLATSLVTRIAWRALKRVPETEIAP